MIRIAVFVLILQLAGCEVRIPASSVEWAKRVCEVNGGLKVVTGDTFTDLYGATCVNGASFYGKPQ